jgi:predicted GTPase
MKNFRFESICLLSQSEQRARKITFGRQRNLIVGRNHTGKSSLIKSLFLAMGARPEGKLDRWDRNTVALVVCSVDEKHYYILQQQSYRALFSGDGKLLSASGSSGDWAKIFAEFTGFNLVLTDQDKEAITADARAFFLPVLHQPGR